MCIVRKVFVCMVHLCPMKMGFLVYNLTFSLFNRVSKGKFRYWNGKMAGGWAGGRRLHFYYLLTTQQEFVRVITYRAYNIIQARQCTLGNDLFYLCVKKDSLFWTILELLAYHPIFWHVNIHTKKSALMNYIEKRPTVTFATVIFTPEMHFGER